MSRQLKEVTFGDAIAAADMKVGESLEGTFSGIRSFDYEDGKQGVIYNLTSDAGVEQSIFGTAQLKALMKNIRVGSYVKLEYAGKKKIPGSPQPAHQFKVMTDNAGTGALGGLEVNTSASSSSAATTPAGGSFEGKFRKAQ